MPIVRPTMPPAPPRYGRARLAEAAGLPVAAVEVVASIGSTSTALLQRAFGAQPAPARVLVAIEQTAGRGRRGRAWSAAADCSMTLSVAIERALVEAQARPYRALPLALGAALAERLDGFGCALRLKWPNDLQRDGRKVAGLLVEARVSGGIERVVVGLGLNLLPDAALGAALDQPIGALFAPPAEAPGDGDLPSAAGARGPPLPDRSALAGALAGTIVRACARNAADGFEPFRAGWQARDALAAGAVRILEPDGSGWDGEAAGIDDDGALVVRTPGGVRRVLAAEVSVRARPSHAKVVNR